MRITKKIMLWAALLPVAAAWSGDLTVDNLEVTTNATVYGNLNFSYIAGGNFSNGAAATGGAITTNGNYKVHTFTNNGAFEVSGGSLTCLVLVVAGGAGGGAQHGGGGGAGGLIYEPSFVATSGSHTVTVGVGGAGSPGGSNGSSQRGNNGSNSVFGALTAIGGGAGGCYRTSGGPTANGGNSGGSGGGGAPGDGTPGGSGGAGTNNQGYAGADGRAPASASTNGYVGSGGGGAGEAGAMSSNHLGGQGGDGLSYFGSTYAGGGGGGGYYDAAAGSGGAGGGGGGGSGTAGTNGAANTGGGGGAGGAYDYAGGNGGSGIVIVRYQISTSSTNAALTISSNGVNQISASVTNVFMGKVGVGANNPAEKLHVAGNVQVDGSIKFGNETRTNWPNVAAGALLASNNLSDVNNAAAARANLGLGSAATNQANAFLAPAGNGSQLTNITAAQVGALSTNAGALLAANNLSDVANTATARANLGLGSAATSNSEAFLAPAGNGSQLTGLTAAQVGALSTNGGAVSGNVDFNGLLSIEAPIGDVPMGVYTNQ